MSNTLSFVTTSVAVVEGNSGTAIANFTVQRLGDTSGAASVDWAVQATSVSPSDFAGGLIPSGTLSFLAGETSKTIAIALAGDTTIEGNEAFTVRLFSPVGAIFTGMPGQSPSATGTIVNDDGAILSIQAVAQAYEGTAANGSVDFVVTRSGNTSIPASANWAVSVPFVGFNPAIAADFVGGALPSGVVSFAAGETSKIISIPTLADAVVESNESFTLTLTNPSADAIIGQGSASGVIVNDEGTTTLVLSGPSGTLVEGQSGGSAVSFTVTRLGDPSLVTTANWAVTAPTLGQIAATGDDFVGGVLPSGTVSFAAGELTRTITIEIAGDTTIEPGEAFSFLLSGATGGAFLSNPSLTNLVIPNDDGAIFSLRPSIVGSNPTIGLGSFPEGNSGTANASFIILRQGDLGGTVSVNWGVTLITGFLFGGTAADAADFPGGTLPGGSVTFAPGETSKLVTFGIQGDTTPEGEDQFNVVLSAPTAGGALASSGSVGVMAIANDDPVAVLTVSAIPAVTEGNAGATPVTFTITRSGNTAIPASATWSVSGAVNAADFVGNALPTGTVSFAAGETVKTISFDVAGDTVVEANESFTVSLSGFSPGAGGNTPVQSTLVNDDGAILSLSGTVSQAEGNSGGTPFVFTVTRGGDTSVGASANWFVQQTGIMNGMLGADVFDFMGSSLPGGTVQFEAGETSKAITVQVAGDTFNEGTENFAVVLANPSVGASLGTSVSAIGTILNDDAATTATISLSFVGSSFVNEGNSGGTPVTFSVTRTGNLSQTSTVNWAITGFSSTTNIAASADDFAGGSFPTGMVTFAPGQDSQTITVNLAGDALIEPNETFVVSLTSPSVGTALSVAGLTGTIVNDDGALLSIFSGTSGAEGQTGSTPFTFNVTRGGNTGVEASARWFVAPVTFPNSASASDFVGGTLPGGTVSFAAGETSKTITVQVAGDTLLEFNEGFEVRLVEPSAGASIVSASTTASIANDDGAILSLGSGPGQLTEGNAGTTTAIFTVTRSGDVGIAASANWSVIATPSGLGLTGINGADFVGGILPMGMVSFAVGETSKTIELQFAGDTLIESNEGLSLQLASPSAGASISLASASLTLVNDDGAIIGFAGPTVVTVVEGDSGTTPLTFTVTRGGDTGIPASADWAVSPGSATANDFVGGVLPSGTVSFAMGETSKTITVNIAGDTNLELNESFSVQLSNPSVGAVLNANTLVSATIATDDGTTGVISLASSNPTTLTVIEGNSTNSSVLVSLQRTGDTSGPAIANWAVTAGTADAADFLGGVLPSGSVFFAPGQTTSSFTFNVAGDTLLEPNESFGVTLTGVSSGASLGALTTLSGIINNDDGATISVTNNSGFSADEGQSGSTPFTITITRSGDTSTAVSADWAVAASTALGVTPASAADFAGGVFPSGTVSFAAGETRKTITVNLAGDTVFERSESFVVNLSNPSVGSVIGNSASFTILDDDGARIGLVTQTLPTVFEGLPGASTPMTFGVQRSGNTSLAVSVNWLVVSTSSLDGNDFAGGVLPSGTLSFAPGETLKTITLDIAGDSTVENNELVPLFLSTTIGDASLFGATTLGGTIFNDDPTFIAIAATDADKAEGNGGGSTPFTFTITRSGDVSGISSVGWSYNTPDIAGVPTASPSDFLNGVTPSGTVTFLANETSKTVTVNVAADGHFESDERFNIGLFGASNAVITTSTATGIIRADDAPIIGTPNPESLAGTASNDLIQGLAGADTIDGAAGNDTLQGDEGADRLTGGTGADRFVLAVDGPARSTLASMDVILDFNEAELDTITLGGVNGTLTLDGVTRTFILNGGTGIFLNAVPTLGLSLPAQHHNIPSFQAFWLQGVDGTGTPEARGWLVVDVDGDQLLGAQDFIAEVRGALSGRDLTFPTFEFLSDVQRGTGLTAPTGTAGNDTLPGTGRSETFIGTTGSDVVNGGPAAFNSITYSSFGTPIAVTVTGVGSATVVKNGGTQGTDTLTNIQSIITGSGNDSFDITALTIPPLYAGGVQPNGGDDTVTGGFMIQDDGTNFANTVVAYAGGTSAATINLGTGTANDGLGGIDTLINIRRVSVTSSFNDTVLGSAFSDQVSSSATGNRTIDLGAGTGDRWSMGSNARSFTFGPPTNRVEVELGTGTSGGEITGVARKYTLSGSVWTLSGTDSLRGVEQANGSIGNDLLVGSDAANSFFGGEGNDTINGGAGLDTVRHDSFTGGSNLAEFGVTVNLTTGTATDAWGFTDTLISMEHAYGTQQADDLTGVSVAGSRTLLRGLAGNDTLRAPEVDTLIAADYRGDRGAVTVNLATGLATDGWGDTDRLVNIQSVIGSRFGDSLTGGARNDLLEGGAGNDSLAGGGGTDIAIFAGARSGYTITRDSVTNALTVVDNTAGRDGTDLLAADIETLRFSDGDYPASLVTMSATSFLSIAALSADRPEGNAGSTAFTFTVTRLGSTTGASSANWAVTGAAIAADFAGSVLPTGAVSFAAGETTKTITIDVAGEALFETDEGFTVTLSAPSGAAITTATANAVIRNDDLVAITGTSGNDTITPGLVSGGVTGGTPGAADEVIAGLDGNDSLDGGSGHDSVEGGLGNDTLRGSDGNDTLIGGTGNDFFTPGPGNDSMVGGGDQGDVIVPFDATGPLVIDIAAGTLTGQGNDSFSGIANAQGGNFADSISGSSANQYFFGRAGNDTLRGLDGIDNLIGGSGADLVDGGEGTDRASYNDDGMDAAGVGTRGAVVNLSASFITVGADTISSGTAIDNWGGRDTLVSIEDVGGGSMADYVVGSEGANGLQGLGGNDTMLAGGGNDHLDGGEGNDSLHGGAGNDVFVASLGNDTMDGGDTIVRNTANYNGFTGPITVTLTNVFNGTVAKAGGTTDTLINISDIRGTASGDTYIGNGTLVDVIGARFRPGAGNDTVNGAGSTNIAIDYTDALKAINVNLALNTASQDGFDGTDTLNNVRFIRASNFDDTITGSGAAETFGVQGGGNKRIDGGAGEDTYRWNGNGAVVATLGATTEGGVPAGTVVKPSGTDTIIGIENFVGGSGNDRITGSSADNMLSGEGGADTIDGGAGFDTLDLNQITTTTIPPGGASVNLSGEDVGTLLAGTVLDGFGFTDTLLSIEGVIGTNFGDVMYGSAAANRLVGGGGDDLLFGLGGNDTLIGDAGFDTVVFYGSRDQYVITRNSVTGDLTVVGSALIGDGTDLVHSSVERLAFIDGYWPSSTFTGSTLSIAALSADKSEGNSGVSSFTFTVTRAGDITGVSSAAWAVTGAVNAADFAGGVLPSGTVTFVGGDTSQTITIEVAADLLGELDESFTVTLSGATGATLGTATANGVIRNDDPIAITGTSGNDTITPALVSGGVTGGPPGTGSDTILGLGGNDVLDGGSGNDTVDGGEANDTLTGGIGTDSLSGGAGDDQLTGGTGNDTQTGGLGVDRFLADAGTDTITDLGLGGADVLVVSAGASAFATLGAAWTATAESLNNGTASLTAAGFNANLALAGGANGWIVSNAASTRGVTLTGSNANDSLTGGSGADILTGGLGDDRLIGGLGVDRFIVDAGTDRVTDLGVGGVDRLNVSAGATASVTLGAAWVANSFSANNGTVRLSTAGFDVDLTGVVGASGWSVSNSGQTAAVTLTGSVRADTLTGGDGSDSLTGGIGNDSLSGGAGDDVLTGGTGNDILIGGLGLDSFLVDVGTDTITDLGLGGADVLVVSAGAAAFATLGAAWTATMETLNDGTANLTAAGFSVNLALAGGANAWFVSNAASTRGVTLTGSDGNDSLLGGGGADILTGGLGDDRLTGGLGVDRFIVDAGTDRITDLGVGGVDRLNVSAGATASATLGAAWVANSFTANNGTARLAASGFDVDLTGVVGASGWSVSNSGETVGVRLTGSVRSDLLTGGNGNDSLFGGLDHDTLSGGAGDDEFTGGQGFDRLIGGLGADRFVVDVGRDTITDLGVGGVDVLVILAGAQAVAELGANWAATASSVNDGLANLTAAGFSVDLRLAGGGSGWVVTNAGYAAGVSLIGSNGNDSLTGGNGNDTLEGGLGADVLRARSGADTFVFASAAAANGDVIVDFVVSQGDMLDLRGIDAGTAAGDQAFSFIGGAAFASGVQGQLRFAGGVLQGDVNGDGVADFQVQMTGVTSLSAASIWL